MNQEKIGKFMATCRKNKKMTQQQLAEKLNVNVKSVSRWECGKCFPDASLYLDICSILGISLNELFAGEYLKEKEVIKQSEKNILNIINLNNIKNKRNKIILISLIIILFIFIGKNYLINKGIIIDNNLKYSQSYLVNESNIKGSVDVDYFSRISIDFDIGANKYGYAVFKNPHKALKRLKKDYKDTLKLIQKEFNLLPLCNLNYQEYKTYGWQVTTGSSEEKKEAKFVSEVLDIYENSFN